MEKKQRLDDWNEAISKFDGLAADLRGDIIGMRDCWLRRRMRGFLRFVEEWAARGRRWRSEDMSDE